MFPFLTISNLFVSVSQNLYFSKINNHTVSTWLITEIVIKTTSSLCLIFITNYYNSKLKNETHEMCKKINLDQRLSCHSRTALTYTINHSVDKQITAWGFFNIDLSLILSFLSSIVTFTILFLA